jgi:hypothetical protein
MTYENLTGAAKGLFRTALRAVFIWRDCIMENGFFL